MNLIFSFLNSVLIAIVFVSVLGPHQVNAAVCTEKTNFTCVASDFTESTCNKTSRVCVCKPDYEPIPTGCTLKENKTPPKTATVSIGTRIGQRVLPTEDITLTCVTDTEPDDLTYEWKKDGNTVSSESKKQLVVTGADVLGEYSCTVKDKATNKPLATSKGQQIVPFDATTVTPIVTPPPISAPAGSELLLECVVIPFGATYKFKLNPSGTLVDKVKQDSTNTDITCVLDDINGVTWATKESASVKMPTSDNYTPNINASSTTVSPGSRLTLNCLADPTAQLAWVKDGKTIARETERLIQIGNFQPTDAGKYVCTATKDKYIAYSKEAVITSDAPGLPAIGSTINVLVAVLSWSLL